MGPPVWKGMEMVEGETRVSKYNDPRGVRHRENPEQEWEMEK